VVGADGKCPRPDVSYWTDLDFKEESVDVDRYARDAELTKKIVAQTHVVFERKLPAPRPPKTC
jgi:hypothetical protein